MRAGCRQYACPTLGWVYLMAALLWVTVPGATERPPSWVSRFPHDPDQYIGIGHVDKHSHGGEYREMALSAALAQISREISIQVKAENSSKQSEISEVWEESYHQQITTASQNKLSGYQLADVYETENEFWALYTLDKTTFLKAEEEKEKAFATWLSTEDVSLDSDLEARLIQSIVNRYSRIQHAYLAFEENHAIQAGYASAISAKYAEISGKIQRIINYTELVAEGAPWIFRVDCIPKLKNHYSAQVYLVDTRTKEKWKGPISLYAVERYHNKKPVCQMETNTSGQLNLSKPLLECKLEPAIWTLDWLAGEYTLHMDVEVKLQPTEMSLVFKADGLPISGNLSSRIQKEIAALHSPYYRIVPAHAGIPEYEFHLQSIVQDSLEGMYFTSISATVLFPGSTTPWKVWGKSGHSNKLQSQERAIFDLVREMEKLPLADGAKRD